MVTERHPASESPRSARSAPGVRKPDPVPEPSWRPDRLQNPRAQALGARRTTAGNQPRGAENSSSRLSGGTREGGEGRWLSPGRVLAWLRRGYVGSLAGHVGRPRGLVFSLAYWTLRRLLELVVLWSRSEREKEIEILVLRHQLQLLQRQGVRVGPKNSI